MSSLPATYKKWNLVKRPSGIFKLEDFQLVEDKLDSTIRDGEIFVKVIYLSLDPTLLFWADEKLTYMPKIELGSVMRCFGVGKVLASKCSRIQEGDLVSGMVGFQEYSVMNAEDPHSVSKVNDDPKYPLHISINNFGITGMSAYFALLTKGNPKEGETLVISGASGATGLMAGVIGKIKGCRVIGIAGSDEKCKNLTDNFKFDAAINYKTQNVDEELKKLCPEGADIFFDNVGGAILDAFLNNIKFRARVIMCGYISQYDAASKRQEEYKYKNLTNIILKEGQVSGFFLPAHRDQYHTAAKDIHEWLEEGKMTPLPVKITKGISEAIDGLIDMFNGGNIGKAIVEVCAPPAPFHD